MAAAKKKGGKPSRSNAATRVLGAAGDEQAARRVKRHLEDLERANYTESSGTGAGTWHAGALGTAEPVVDDGGDPRLAAAAPSDEPGSKRKKQTTNVRALLLYRRNLSAWLEEANLKALPRSTPTYLTATAAPSRLPPTAICTVCGTFGAYKCSRCRLMYCSVGCQSTHDESRCERRIL